MTTQEAKERITQEFIDGFVEWLKDEAEMSDFDYGRKYGWGKGAVRHTDNFDGFKVYMDYFFTGRYLPGWVRQGYEEEAIWGLYHEGFLSYKNYSNWDARMRNQTQWFYIGRKTARAIFNTYKATKK